MIILSLNCGSSSLKFMLFDYARQETMATGIVERVTVGGSFIKYAAGANESVKSEHDCPDHREAIQLILKTLQDPKLGVIKDLSSITAVGH